MRLSATIQVLAFAVVMAVAAPGAQAFEYKPFDAAAFHAAQVAGKPIVVDVFAPWCPTCKAQQEVFKSLEGKPEFTDVLLLKVDFDTQTEDLKALRVRGQSTLIAYKGTKETGRSVGDTNAKSIEALVASTLK